MSEEQKDKYEHYNYDHDKHMYSGHSGKQRSKKEAEQHTNQHDVGGRGSFFCSHTESLTHYLVSYLNIEWSLSFTAVFHSLVQNP